jgi:hypothetical protein
METVIRQIPTLLNATGVIVTAKVEEQAGIPYSCPAKRRHSDHNDDVGWLNSIFWDPSTVSSAGLRSPPPLAARVASREGGTCQFPVVDGKDEADHGDARVKTLAAASVSFVREVTFYGCV